MKHRLILLAILPIILLAPLIVTMRYCWCILRNPAKAWKIAIAFDRLTNIAANGSEYETISSRAFRAKSNGRKWGCVLCRLLDRLDPNHCDKSAGV